MSGPLLEIELRKLLNCYSRENESNTPDYILAKFMMDCLDAYEMATNRRDKWFGIKPAPGSFVALTGGPEKAS